MLKGHLVNGCWKERGSSWHSCSNRGQSDFFVVPIDLFLGFFVSLLWVFILYSFPCVQLLLKTETAATLVAVWHFAKLSSTFRFKCSRPPTPSNLLTPHQLRRGPSISSQIQNALSHKIFTRTCPTHAGHKLWKMITPYSKKVCLKEEGNCRFFKYLAALSFTAAKNNAHRICNAYYASLYKLSLKLQAISMCVCTKTNFYNISSKIHQDPLFPEIEECQSWERPQYFHSGLICPPPLTTIDHIQVFNQNIFLKIIPTNDLSKVS